MRTYLCVWRLRHSLKGLNSVYVIKLKFIIKAVLGPAWLYIRPLPPLLPPSAFSTHTHTRIESRRLCVCVVLVLCKLVFKFCDRTNKMSTHTHARTHIYIYIYVGGQWTEEKCVCGGGGFKSFWLRGICTLRRIGVAYFPARGQAATEAATEAEAGAEAEAVAKSESCMLNLWPHTHTHTYTYIHTHVHSFL